MKRFICVQTGARRAYAVPRLLAGAGMLERFHTDFAGNLGGGRYLAALHRVPGLRSLAARVAGRRIPPEILALTNTHDGGALRHFLRDALGRNDPESRFRRAVDEGRRFGESILRHDFGRATHVYAMLNEGGPFLDAARARGLTLVSEVYILLSTERIVAAEQAAYPDWEPAAADYETLRNEILPEHSYPRNADLCVCPSEAVREDLVANWGVARENTALVPYGMDPKWLDLEPRPEPGRILFVGTADLRKGIHHLARAAAILRNDGFSGEFRIAGHATDTVRRHPECRHLKFLGRVPRHQIHEEFQRADLFVLPSLAEGSAEVTYEALAAGVPQIVTRAAGSVARDGIDGLLVPERDSLALAAAIARGVSDRAWRDCAARESRTRAREFTWERYGERLVAALQAAR